MSKTALLLLTLTAAALLGGCGGKSAEEKLTDRLFQEAARKAGEVDLKKVEAEANRLKDRLSEEDKAKAKEALKKIQERL